MAENKNKSPDTSSFFLHKLECNVFLYKRILIILGIAALGFLVRNYLFFLFVYDIAVYYFLIYLTGAVIVLGTRIVLPLFYRKQYYRISNMLIILSCAYIFYSLVIISILDSVSIKDYKYVNDHNYTAYIFGLVLVAFTLRISWKISSAIFFSGMALFVSVYNLYTHSIISFQSIFPLLIINILSLYFSYSREKYYRNLYHDKSIFENQSIIDSLTQVYNRRYLSIILKDRFSMKIQQTTPFCCIFTDIDHFKSVNDTYGHDTGDKVLKQFAEVLLYASRESDAVIRFGGEEFIVVLNDTQLNEACKIAERIRNTIETTDFNTVGRKLTASFGVTEAESGDVEDDLLKRADKLLYQAKEEGRNRCCCG